VKVKRREVEKISFESCNCSRLGLGELLVCRSRHVGHLVVALPLKAKLKSFLLFLLFKEINPKHKVKDKLGYFEPLLAMISPVLLALLGFAVLSYGLIAFILYYVCLSLILLEIFHVAFDRS